MRQKVVLFGRGVSALALVVFVAVSAAARPAEGELPWRWKGGNPLERIVKVVKKAIGNLGDGLTGPRP